MKRLALVAAVIAVAACSKADNAAMDSTPPAAAPPAMSDSMRMADSIRMADSVRRADSVRVADSVAGKKKTP
jgi:uncharacterized lipoprotein YajG